MAEQQERRKGSWMRVKTPFGELTATGSLVVLILLGALSTIAVASMVRDHDLRANERADRLNAHAKAVADRVNELSYIMTLSDEEKKKINLNMPETLRERIRR